METLLYLFICSLYYYNKQYICKKRAKVNYHSYR